MLIKPGVVMEGVHPWMLYAGQAYDWLHRVAGFGEATVTGGREPAAGRVHNTLHPHGLALDFRFHAIPFGMRRLFGWYLGAILGRFFDVVLEEDHFHIELSPEAVRYVTDNPERLYG